MQEEVENRTLTLVVSGTKFTGRLLKAAISKYMAHCKEKKLQKQRSRDAPVVSPNTLCIILILERMTTIFLPKHIMRNWKLLLRSMPVY